MKVFAIFTQDNKFIAAFPDREDAMNYGIVMFGPEKGWEYCIREMWMYETKQYAFSQPLTQPIPCTPYTTTIPLKTTPYEPNIWCGDGSIPTATYSSEGEKYPSEHISAVGIEGLQGPKRIHSFPVDNGPYAPGTK